MSARSSNERIEILEQKVGDLQSLPDRMTAVESQILQLRGEMRDGFSAMREGDDETRRQMRLLHEEVLSRIALLQEGQRLRVVGSCMGPGHKSQSAWRK